MMTENLRYMQVKTPTVTGLVNATEFRHGDGSMTYTVTVIDDKGCETHKCESRNEAIDKADMYIRLLTEQLVFNLI